MRVHFKTMKLIIMARQYLETVRGMKECGKMGLLMESVNIFIMMVQYMRVVLLGEKRMEKENISLEMVPYLKESGKMEKGKEEGN